MEDSAVVVRKAKAKDMAFVVELWKKFSDELEASDDRYTLRLDAEILWAKYVGERIKDEDSLMLVAEAGDEYVGYLIAQATDAQPIFRLRRHVTITDVYVAETHRRKGLATRMMEDTLKHFKKAGIDNARCNVLAKNETAEAFMRKLGFGDFIHRMWKEL